jgi:putative oxidoreductase
MLPADRRWQTRIAFALPTVHFRAMRMTFLSKYREAGLLLLRVTLGCFLIYFSWSSLTGGAGAWAQFAGPLRRLGLHSHLQWWGLACAIAQTLGGALVIFGFFFRVGLILILLRFIPYVFALWKIRPLIAYAELELCLILVSLLLIGPGKLSADRN